MSGCGCARAVCAVCGGDLRMDVMTSTPQQHDSPQHLSNMNDLHTSATPLTSTFSNILDT